ncbi:MAG TPA: hypothetical protein VFN31_00790 [Candidatus Saccharimonadales bacterium]|nr:hypothetical protein [Candidatus Saccharimonadales bacterium]
MTDYGTYQQIEFRRKFFKIFGVDIHVYDPNTNSLIGFINQKKIMLKPDVYFYTDETKTQSVVNLKKQTIGSFKPTYKITDSENGSELGSFVFNDFKSLFARWHIDIKDADGKAFGYVQETSSILAIVRRWIGLIFDVGELILAFIPQTFDIYYDPDGNNPQLVGRIVHRKNPLIVKMGLDISQGQKVINPKINLAVCTLLCLRDINKNA